MKPLIVSGNEVEVEFIRMSSHLGGFSDAPVLASATAADIDENTKVAGVLPIALAALAGEYVTIEYSPKAIATGQRGSTVNEMVELGAHMVPYQVRKSSRGFLGLIAPKTTAEVEVIAHSVGKIWLEDQQVFEDAEAKIASAFGVTLLRVTKQLTTWQSDKLALKSRVETADEAVACAAAHDLVNLGGNFVYTQNSILPNSWVVLSREDWIAYQAEEEVMVRESNERFWAQNAACNAELEAKQAEALAGQQAKKRKSDHLKMIAIFGGLALIGGIFLIFAK